MCRLLLPCPVFFTSQSIFCTIIVMVLLHAHHVTSNHTLNSQISPSPRIVPAAPLVALRPPLLLFSSRPSGSLWLLVGGNSHPSSRCQLPAAFGGEVLGSAVSSPTSVLLQLPYCTQIVLSVIVSPPENTVILWITQYRNVAS